MIEAVRRLFAPVEVLGGVMLAIAIAIAGLAVNGLVLASLRHGDHDNLNIQGALLHVIGDWLDSVVAMVAAVIVPKITASPKRTVGGNVDNPKIPNPTQMRSVAARTGPMIWARAWDQLSK